MHVKQFLLISLMIISHYTLNAWACDTAPLAVRNIMTTSGHVPDFSSQVPQAVIIWDPPLTGSMPEGYYVEWNTSSDHTITIDNAPDPIGIDGIREYVSLNYTGNDDEHYYFHIAPFCFNYDTFDMLIGPTLTFGSIRIDTVPPLNPMIIAPERTSKQTLSIQLGATNATQMYISNFNYGIGGAWEPYATSRTWDLTDDEGLKTIYVQFKDDAGNISTTTTLVTYQKTPFMSDILDQTFMQNTTHSIPIEITVSDSTDLLLSISFDHITLFTQDSITIQGPGVMETIDEYTVTALANQPVQLTLDITPEQNQTGTSEITLTVTTEDNISITRTFIVQVKSIDRPLGLAASLGTTPGQIDLLWNGQPDADYFKLYRSVTNNFSSAMALSDWITQTMYTDSHVITGISYYYWVQASYDSNGTNTSQESLGVDGYSQLFPPNTILVSQDIYSHCIYLMWDSVEGATYYMVYRGDTNQFEAAIPLLEQRTAASWVVDYSVTSQATYYYWVVSANRQEQGITSAPSAPVTGSCNATTGQPFQTIITSPSNPSMIAGIQNQMSLLFSSDHPASITELTLWVYYHDEQIHFTGYTSVESVAVTYSVSQENGYTDTNQMVMIHWQGSMISEALCTLSYTVNETISLNDHVPIYFKACPSGIATPYAAGSVFGKPMTFSLDIDGNGVSDALTDGLIILKYMDHQLLDASDLNPMLSHNAQRQSYTDVVQYIDNGQSLLDIDCNGVIDTTTDGTLIMRYLFGFNQQSLLEDAIGSESMRQSIEDIQAYLDRLAIF